MLVTVIGLWLLALATGASADLSWSGFTKDDCSRYLLLSLCCLLFALLACDSMYCDGASRSTTTDIRNPVRQS